MSNCSSAAGRGAGSGAGSPSRPWADTVPPCRWVRGEHYRYKFSRPGGRHAAEGKWWVRKRIGAYFPPLSLEELRPYFRDRGWPLPQPL